MIEEQFLDVNTRRMNSILNHLSKIIIPIMPQSFDVDDVSMEESNELDRIINEATYLKEYITKHSG